MKNRHFTAVSMRIGFRPATLPGALVALLAGLHLVLTLAFTLSIASATSALSDDGLHCSGVDLVAQLESQSPEKLVAARTQADAIINAKSIFWKVSKPGLAESYLFGTMHSADPRIARLEGQVRSAFDASTKVIVESTEALDPALMKAEMLKLKHLAFLPAGTTLETLLPAEKIAKLQAQAQARSLPWNIASRMQPWMIAAAIARPVCESGVAAQAGMVLDQLVASEAKAAGKTLAGLESIADQFNAVASIPAEFHLNALADLVELGGLANDVMETTKLLYLKGDTGLMLPLMRFFSPAAYTGKGFAEFQENLIGKRNSIMASRSARLFANGSVFMAVGAMHLPGENGLVNLLRQQGYELEPLAKL